MRSLYESILDKDDKVMTGIEEKAIRNWCNDNLYVWTSHSNYKLTDKLEVVPSQFEFELRYDTYDEIPSYIKFDVNNNYSLTIQETQHSSKIKSFRGLPERLRELKIKSESWKIFPSLNIDVDYTLTIQGNFNKIEQSHIKMVHDGRTSVLHLDVDCDLSNLHITGVRVINLNFNQLQLHNMKKLLWKSVGQKNLEYNKNESAFILNDVGEKKLQQFFGGIDLGTVKKILLDDRYALLHTSEGKWQHIMR